MDSFKLSTNFTPKGDQPKAIKELCEGIESKKKHQVLLGITGSGKTYTMANVIAKLNCPALIAAPNKTLAAQLYEEFKEFFPENHVHYFVSYYDFYQPEAYIPSTDTFIEKDSQINEEIDRLRHATTHSLLSQKDIIIIASVSFIYGLGSPEVYKKLHVEVEVGQRIKRKKLLESLVEILYERNDMDFHRGSFRARGDTVEIFPAYEEDVAIRVEFFGDEIDSIILVDPLRGVPIRKLQHVSIYPASHYVTEASSRKKAITTIQDELRERLQAMRAIEKEGEARRLEQRTLYDIEMMEELGYCQGIENYSRHLSGRPTGAPPPTLLEYFQKNFLMIVDESHITIPQIGGMYRGDRARKMNLVEHGFRLPSALDNRPLNFEEFEQITEENAKGVIYVSATPGDYELEKTKGEYVEQIIRPTGLLDPKIYVRPALTQIEDLFKEIQARTQVPPGTEPSRVLVTVLTKKFAEDLTTYLLKKGVRVRYLHSDVETLDRIEILRDLRKGIFDVLVGINLLREGLDLPEVSLVAIVDADKPGFLRSNRSLIQTIGRASRNVDGTVILYGDKVTSSMNYAIQETQRRRDVQFQYNKKHGITPETIKKSLRLSSFKNQRKQKDEKTVLHNVSEFQHLKSIHEVRQEIKSWNKKMITAAQERNFEYAAKCRDKVQQLKKLELKLLSLE